MSPAVRSPPALAESHLWKPLTGCEWQRKRGKAKSAAWDYFRVEVPVGSDQSAACDIICVHEDHHGERIVVKAPSNTSNLHRHLMTTHSITVAVVSPSSGVGGVGGAEHASQPAGFHHGSGAPGGGALLPTHANSHHQLYQHHHATSGAGGAVTPGSGARSMGIVKKSASRAAKRGHTFPRGPNAEATASAAATAAAVATTSGSVSYGVLDGKTLPLYGQEHEDDVARVIIVCAPSLSKTMGALHPAGALYARPVDINKAREAHAAFVSLLKHKGVETYDVREILGKDADWSMGDRCKLEDLAAKSLTYAMDSSPSANGAVSISNASHYVSDLYKRSVLCEMDVSQLVDIVMTNPTVTITDTGRDTGLMAKYSFAPSTNILFTRDQQVTTIRGVVMGRLRSGQRRQEVDVLEFCLRKLGVNVLGRVERGFLEGGDFFPCGRERCFIGVGPRSTFEAVSWMMENDMFGTDSVIVVRDELDMSQDRMHLDCIFNVIGKMSCLLLDSVIGQQEDDKHRVVDIWRRSVDGTNVSDVRHGRYELAACDKGIEFAQYLASAGFKIITISSEEQLEYGCNVLNLGQGRLISTEKQSARRIATDPNFVGTVDWLPYSDVTSMYGGVHCTSQVVCRSAVE
jgi:arginine deiminase